MNNEKYHAQARLARLRNDKDRAEGRIDNKGRLMYKKSEALQHVLDAVRATGKSAFPAENGYVADVVWKVAISRGLNPRELQAEVIAYADWLDSL